MGLSVLLLLSALSAHLVSAAPVERAPRALELDGGPSPDKGALHRQRLALYNILESPGYNPDLQRHPISRYIPLGMETQQQAVVQPSKETPFIPPITSGIIVPSDPTRAPYAQAQFIRPLDYQQFYPYQPFTMYAPAYPYVYKSMTSDELP